MLVALLMMYLTWTLSNNWLFDFSSKWKCDGWREVDGDMVTICVDPERLRGGRVPLREHRSLLGVHATCDNCLEQADKLSRLLHRTSSQLIQGFDPLCLILNFKFLFNIWTSFSIIDIFENFFAREQWKIIICKEYHFANTFRSFRTRMICSMHNARTDKTLCWSVRARMYSFALL